MPLYHLFHYMIYLHYALFMSEVGTNNHLYNIYNILIHRDNCHRKILLFVKISKLKLKILNMKEKIFSSYK